jgi:hypothetical protein
LNTGKRTVLLFLLTAIPVLYVPAQTTAATTSNAFDTTGLPQWVKDLRRWEIVAFGSIPFTMFTATFAMDMYRWQNANGLNFSDEGRRYAPWPIKSAGAVAMESKEMEQTLIIAASLSGAVAIADLIIVQIKRHNARKRAEALPVGTVIITRNPWSAETPPEQDNAEVDESVPADPDSSLPAEP